MTPWGMKATGKRGEGTPTAVTGFDGASEPPRKNGHVTTIVGVVRGEARNVVARFPKTP